MADKWPDCSKDRADLLLHVEALEQGFERLRNTASHYWCKRFWEERDRVYALEQEVERLRELPEHIELDLMNAGAVGLAKQLLSDDGRGEMSPGPCADALALIRKLKTAERKLARLEREFVRFYQVAHQASRGSEGPLAVLRSALEWLEAQDWFRRIKEAGDE